jgi:hypothetical protein
MRFGRLLSNGHNLSLRPIDNADPRDTGSDPPPEIAVLDVVGLTECSSRSPNRYAVKHGCERSRELLRLVRHLGHAYPGQHR